MYLGSTFLIVYMTRKLKFYKDENSRWFADIPEWQGTKEDLEMVMGADTMLDIIAQGDEVVYLTFSDEPISDSVLNIIDETMTCGATYLVTTLFGLAFDFEIWLCDVTKFVFNSEKMPYKIYLAK